MSDVDESATSSKVRPEAAAQVWNACSIAVLYWPLMAPLNGDDSVPGPVAKLQVITLLVHRAPSNSAEPWLEPAADANACSRAACAARAAGTSGTPMSKLAITPMSVPRPRLPSDRPPLKVGSPFDLPLSPWVLAPGGSTMA